jgi:tetratricopeptide (TPR) repeat protein
MTGRVTAAIALLFTVAALAQEPPAPAPAPAPQPAPAETQQPANHDEFTQEVYFGKQFADMKDYAAAYKHFANADALQPDNPGVLYNMGVLLAKAGRYSEAQSKVDRYNQLYPNGAEKALIRSLQFALNFQRELQKQRQADQSYSELFTRGRFFYSRNDLTVALKQFQDAEQQRPADAAAVFNQAVIFEKMGDFAKAAERFHRYGDLEADADAKTSAQQRLLLLESEIEDMKVKIVCAFCGYRLHLGALWCPRCWHGPYLTTQPVWSSRPCVEGASATRTTYASANFAKNDTLPCLFDGSLREALRYSPAKQRMIQDARKAEGWTYNGEIIQGLRDQLRYVQGPEYLERIIAPATGETLNFVAHKSGETWLLDREEMLIDGIKFTSRYSFDPQNRISQQIVDYQNTAGCNHLITMTATYKYNGDVFTGATIRGGYEGFVPEGSPKMDWTVNVAETYDANGRVTREDVALATMEKKYMSKPVGKLRDELSNFYDGWHVNQPIANIMTKGDICALSGTAYVGNPIDLRPFYAMSPNLGMVLPLGVTKASVALTYPDSFSAR